MSKKQKIAEQPELRPIEAAAPTPAVPRPVAEYQPVSESGMWRVEQWELFQGEFASIKPDALPEFHNQVSRSARAWMIVRRLFGFRPLRIPLSGNPDDYRTWSRLELCAALGIQEKELAAELEAVRAFWQKQTQVDQPPPAPAPDPVAGTAQLTLVETDEEIFKRFGFNPGIFDLPHRTKEENEFERSWFTRRAREWGKLFERSMTARLATQALYNEMRLRREENALWDLDRQPPPESLEKRNLLEKNKETIRKRISELEETYQEQLRGIEEIAPWFNATGKQISVTGAVAELIKGIQEYKSRGDNKLLDGVFTALELQVLLQQSQQIPEPTYRFGWVTYINSTKSFLGDPEFKPHFRPSDLAKLDAGFKAGVKAFTEERGDALPDLERDGPEGEYEELYSPENKKEAQGR